MNKDDILEKARQENKDEQEKQVNIVSNRIGWIGVSTVMIFLIFWRAIHGESASDIMMILTAQIVAATSYQYVKIPDKKIYLISAIFGTVGFGLALAALLSEYGVF